MCLVIDKDATTEFKAKQPEDKWFVVWKVLKTTSSGGAVTPFKFRKVSLDSQELVAKGRLCSADIGDGIVGSGAIHAYTSRAHANVSCCKAFGEVVCKAYVKAHDVLYIGEGHDVAVKRLVLDQDDLNHLRQRCAMRPIKWR